MNVNKFDWHTKPPRTIVWRAWKHFVLVLLLAGLACVVVWLAWHFAGGWQSFIGLMLSIWWAPTLLVLLAIDHWEQTGYEVDRADGLLREKCGVRWLIDDERVTVSEDGGERRQQTIRYDELRAVRILTSSGGPFVEDFYYVLDDGEWSVDVPLSVACEHGLTDHLFALPGFDYRTVVEASGCTENRVFIAWDADWAS